MRSDALTLGVQLVLAGILSIVAVSAQVPSGPAQPSSPFVGTWVLNIAKSTYEGIPPEQRRTQSTRTIDVEANGVFVETHRNITGGGRQGFYHWVGRPDGPEISEFGRTSGTVPGNRLTIKTVNDHQWAVTFRNPQGMIVLTDTWTVSPDGKTLTIDRKGTPPKGSPNHSVEVFDNEGWAMPGAGR